jgi:hypothetical protein
MRMIMLVAATASCAVLLAGSGVALADKPTTTPGPSASPPAKAKAYGRYCRGQSKKHVAGQKGTPFSQCVTAMAKLATATSKSPNSACRTLSRKHVAGQKGTPFSRCVTAAAQLLQDQGADGGSASEA